MFRFILVALAAFLFPGIAYYLWRVYAPERFGGSPALAHGDWRPMPWRKLAYAGLATLALAVLVMVSVFESAPPLRQTPYAAPPVQPSDAPPNVGG